MGKGSNWLTAVKRAFRSPSKDTEKNKSRRKIEHQQEEDEEKKIERKRWLFRKPYTNAAQLSEVKVVAISDRIASKIPSEHKHAASEAQHYAAKLIQTAFRGYLGRKALIALKGIVKLQALIRGQNVRKQANMTMKCMQALLRVQARVREQRARLSQDGGRKSMFAETNNIWESRSFKHRKSMSRDGSFSTDDLRDCPRTLEELDAIVKARNEAVLMTHQRSLASAFSQQNKIWDSDKIPYDGYEYELETPSSWLDKYTASKQWEVSRDSIKTVDIDSLRTPSYSSRKSRCQSPLHKQHSPHIATSPHHRYSLHSLHPPPLTPTLPSKSRIAGIRSSSPRRVKEEKSYSTANTPSLRSLPRTSTTHESGHFSVPNYMAATESAKARIRSQSAPKQRPSTPDNDRGGSARKRLSYPVKDPLNCGFGCNSFNLNLTSPSFKSVQAGYVGMEQQSNLSYYTDSVGGEISPCSTTDLRRWLR